MALSNTYDTTNPGSAVSNREDLLDVITTLAPQETPILSMAPKRKATATFHEYTVDSLSAPSTTGVSEGADVTAFVDKLLTLLYLRFHNRVNSTTSQKGHCRKGSLEQVNSASGMGLDSADLEFR